MLQLDIDLELVQLQLSTCRYARKPAHLSKPRPADIFRITILPNVFTGVPEELKEHIDVLPPMYDLMVVNAGSHCVIACFLNYGW